MFLNKNCPFFSQIFWLGDLNYRINEIPGQLVDRNDIRGLLKNDQLIQEMRKHNVFKGFTEGEIQFNPTYKYDPGTDQYDSSEKMRAPAWCDRILTKGDRIQLCGYDSVMEIRQSDHKPVYAIFSVGIKSKDEKKYKRVHEDVLKTVDKYENDNQPQICVEKTEIDFHEIRFNERFTRDFTIANSHHLSANFSFKEKDERQICNKWFKVEPTSGTLFTGKFLVLWQSLFAFFKLSPSSPKRNVCSYPFGYLYLSFEFDPRSLLLKEYVRYFAMSVDSSSSKFTNI